METPTSVVPASSPSSAGVSAEAGREAVETEEPLRVLGIQLSTL